MAKSTIREKRRRRNKNNVTSNDDIYISMDNEVFDAPEETVEYVAEIKEQTVERKRFRPLMGEEYDFTRLAEKYS